jgi:putative transposase
MVRLSAIAMFFHVWFATRSRKWLLQGELVDAAKDLMKAVATERSICLLECEAVVDHVHLLLELESKADLPKAMNFLKGSSSRRLSQMFPDVQQDAGISGFWQAGYASKIVPPRAVPTVRRYIQTQWDRLEDYVR